MTERQAVELLAEFWPRCNLPAAQRQTIVERLREFAHDQARAVCAAHAAEDEYASINPRAPVLLRRLARLMETPPECANVVTGDTHAAEAARLRAIGERNAWLAAEVNRRLAHCTESELRACLLDGARKLASAHGCAERTEVYELHAVRACGAENGPLTLSAVVGVQPARVLACWSLGLLPMEVL